MEKRHMEGRQKSDLIEMAPEQPMVSDLGWEMAQPIYVEELMLPGDAPAAAPVQAGEDTDIEHYIETETDLGSRLGRAEEDQLRLVDALEAQSARAEERIQALQRELEERNRQLAAKDSEIEDLALRLATTTLQRDGLKVRLTESRADAEAASSQPEAEQEDALAELKVRLEERSQLLVAAREEIDHLRADRENIAADLAIHSRVRRYLVGIEPEGLVFEISRPRISIGRTRESDLVLQDPTVSRLHAILNFRGPHATIVDANSCNGVSVNDTVVRHTHLRDGDIIGIGSVRLRYRVASGLEPEQGHVDS